MKNYTIGSGKFTGKMNFSGYTSLGERIHIFGLQMNAIGYTKDEEVKFPFYVIGAVKTINEVDSLMQPTGVTHERLTALSCFKTRAEITQAHLDATLLDAEILTAINKGATTLGLSEASINQLMTASI